MKSLLPLFVFIDACGWELVEDGSFAASVAPQRKRLDTVLGYSSACIPSILSGAWPEEHRNWSYFVYDPAHSPFRWLRPMRLLPRQLTGRRIFRRWLSRGLKAPLKFRGYFDLYNLPFEHISLFDYTEKRSPLKPGGLNRGASIFDFLVINGIPYHASEPTASEPENLASLVEALQTEEVDFTFVYWPELDGLMHAVGTRSPEVPRKLRVYEQWLDDLMTVARSHYDEVLLYVFSDHGMADCTELVDLKRAIDSLPLQMGRDYVVVYDSTMARFWFLSAGARAAIEDRLRGVPQGRILSDEELKRLRVFFPDRYFGELIFLLREGALIVPSHMGERPIRAMHGYHPSNRHSHAALLTNQSSIPEDIVAIPDLFRLMVRDAQDATRRNQGRRSQSSATRPVRPVRHNVPGFGEVLAPPAAGQPI